MTCRLSLSVAALLLISRVAAAQNPPPAPGSVVIPGQQTPAQAAAQAATGRSFSNEQIAEAIRQSGLSPAQVRVRLRLAGYDTTLADPFFAGGRVGAPASGAGQPVTTAAGLTNTKFAEALQSMGILGTGTAGDVQLEAARSVVTAEPSVSSLVFGKDVFTRSATTFDPVTSGPVDPAYRLGVGDQVQLVVTGQVEFAYLLELRRDGTVIVPQVGQISLAGLTLDGARAVLKDRMGRSFSGINSGDARLDLSISRIRSNAVFVIGEVESPGAYQVNALATVFHALARAGGPSERGSFRAVEIRRGNRVIQRLDLYDYLLQGNAEGDIRLDQGDVIFVPLNSRAVAVRGEVRRPKVFELRSGEGFADLMRFSGGFLSTANADRVQIDRVLPAAERRPGIERVKVDVDLRRSADDLSRVPLLDGDVVEVFPIGSIRRNVVNIEGQVFSPGQYEFRPGLTLSQLLLAAQGMMPWALADRVKVVRQVPATGRTTVTDVDASTARGGSFLLSEFDAVEVLDGRLAFPAGTVLVEGAVNLPGQRTFSEGESLRDAIERAGGVKEEAQRVEVYRKRLGAAYSDTTSLRFEFLIGPGFARDTTLRGFGLARDDRVVVLASPGVREQRFVTVAGQFRYPGTYGITENADRISDVVRRAGDLLPGAYPEGFRLVRGGRDVSVDFSRALRGDASNNLTLLNGDALIIDRDPSTVLVTGAVSRASLIKYQRGRSLQDYVELAGGPTERGEERRAVVTYPSGISKRATRVALFFRDSPEVISGATITVPERAESNTSQAEIWQRIMTSATALASLVIAYAAVTR